MIPAVSPPALVSAVGVTKNFPGVRALDRVDFSVEVGEVHALLGENGAGKSTLTKVLAGDYPPDEGWVEVSGHRVRFSSPHDARQAGIRLVTQERSLVPSLSAAENVFMGVLPAKARALLDRRELNRRTRVELNRVGLDHVEPGDEVGLLRPAEQQLVEIARALSREGKVLILDEPTAALSAQETARLFDVVRALRSSGVGILYISHRIGELRDIADRVTVLRDGRVASSHPMKETTREGLVREMIGRELREMYPRRRTDFGEPALVFDHTTVPGICEDVSLTVHRGEIVAVFGLVGSGATELPYVAAGDRPGNGVSVVGSAGLVPADRHAEAILPGSTLRRNLTAPSLGRYQRFGLYQRREEKVAAKRQIDGLHIRPAEPETLISSLSGGNQQKVVVGRWLERGADVLMLAEPTRGVDVGARAEIYAILAGRCEAGAAVFIASSDIDEVAGLADRVLVMANGRIVQQFAGSAITTEGLLEAATR